MVSILFVFFAYSSFHFIWSSLKTFARSRIDSSQCSGTLQEPLSSWVNLMESIRLRTASRWLSYSSLLFFFLLTLLRLFSFWFSLFHPSSDADIWFPSPSASPYLLYIYWLSDLYSSLLSCCFLLSRLLANLALVSSTTFCGDFLVRVLWTISVSLNSVTIILRIYFSWGKVSLLASRCSHIWLNFFYQNNESSNVHCSEDRSSWWIWKLACPSVFANEDLRCAVLNCWWWTSW